MDFSIQPTLEDKEIILQPLIHQDFEELYLVASDPLIWEQHPNKDRWQKDVFSGFFEGAMLSGGAFKIIDQNTNEFIGSTRFYDFNAKTNSILIGYTFYAQKYWGKGVNQRVKRLMLNYLFHHVDEVFFHVGAINFRSQIAMQRLGAHKIGEDEIMYFNEKPKLNFIYSIKKENWIDNL